MSQRVQIETKVPDVDSILRFMKGKSPIPSSAGDGRNSVSSAPSALSPGERAAVSKFLEKRDRTDQAVKTAQQAEDELSAPDGDIPTTVLEAQMGRPLRCDEIVKRLRKLNSNFVFHRSINFPEIMGIYIGDPEAPVYEGQRIRHLIGFEFGYSPEFTVKHHQAKGIKKITRGWRAIVIMLTRDGYINFHDACKAFDVERGRESAKWKQELETIGVPSITVNSVKSAHGRNTKTRAGTPHRNHR